MKKENIFLICEKSIDYARQMWYNRYNDKYARLRTAGGEEYG